MAELEARTAAPEKDAPFPYGYLSSMVSGGTVASPLLAGFSFALVALIISSAGDVRYPDEALAALVLAAASFITAVQCTYSAQQWITVPSEIRDWAPEKTPAWRISVQRLHVAAAERWATRYRGFYRLGIISLYCGVGVALAPPRAINLPRWIAIGLICAALLGELSWIASNWILAGSPTGTWIGEPDEPTEPVKFERIRRSARIRRLARLIVPLVRVERTPD